MPSIIDSVRFPCATVVPNGLSALARSTSTWIHWSSPLRRANASMSSWVTWRHPLGPISRPRSSRSPSPPFGVACAMRAEGYPRTKRGGPEGPPLISTETGELGLPAAAGRTTALASRGAGTGHTRRVLGDVELVRAAGGGLGDPLHGVRVRRRAGHH